MKEAATSDWFLGKPFLTTCNTVPKAIAELEPDFT